MFRLKRPSPATLTLYSVLLGVFFFASPASSVAAASYIAIGVDPDNNNNFPTDIDTYTQLAGRKPDVVYWFEGWSYPLYYSGEMAAINAEGVTPQITWSPGGLSLATLNSGSYDNYIKTQAISAKNYGKPLQIRLAHEFNGSWQTYCPCVNGQTDAQFITFWRHVVDIFRSNGANNVQWVWSPNVYLIGDPGSAKTFDADYPGDAYVDWVGLDGYNFGPPNNPWRSLLQIFQVPYNDLAALTTKPIMIAEYGSTENAGDKAAWLRQGFLTDIPQHMPRIKQVDVFDRVAESDFRINSSPTALAAYQEIVRSPLYGGPAPASPSTPASGGTSPGTSGSTKTPATSAATKSNANTKAATTPKTGTSSSKGPSFENTNTKNDTSTSAADTIANTVSTRKVSTKVAAGASILALAGIGWAAYSFRPLLRRLFRIK